MGFKENLRAELAYSGIFVKELSNLSGVNLHTLNNYLSKKGQLPSVEAGVKIARALGVTAEYLVFGEEDEREEVRANGEIRSIIKIAKKLNDGKRKFALEMMKLLALFK
ncbi:MAG: helix-turn-helix domain-containing protein [Treponema sp.]|nr:helix-turn-helix domain-containing protein [Treponema sp.]